MFIVTDNNVMVNLDNVDKICTHTYEDNCNVSFVINFDKCMGVMGIDVLTLGSIKFRTIEEMQMYIDKELIPLTHNSLNDVSQGLTNIECVIRDMKQ